MIKVVSPFIFLLLFGTGIANAQYEAFREQITAIVNESNGIIGIALSGLESDDSLTVNGHRTFPMQSVFKFPLAMSVLDQVDKGKFTLEQKIHITKADLLPETWSPLRDKYPNGNVDIPLKEVLAFTVSDSDNNGCDILFRLMGGPEVVNNYVSRLGVTGIKISTTEEVMHKDEKAQYTNTATPEAMLKLLTVFYQGKHLSKTSNDFLWKLMVEATTGTDKIKGMLPAGTVVAHKTGFSGSNNKGIIDASNDAGIVMLPNGHYFSIVVFVSGTTDNEKQCSALIARIARASFDFYSFINRK